MDKATILIIEDDPLMGSALSEVLKIRGYDACLVRECEEGRRFVKEHGVDVVLVDLSHPDLSGPGALRQVRDDFTRSEVILLTEYTRLDSAIEATGQWAYAYILKPYEVDQLVLHVRHAVEKLRSAGKLRFYEERLAALAAGLEKERALAREAAVACNRERTEFIASLKKELTTRLNVITGCAAILLKGIGGELSENQRDFAEYILESGRALQNRFYYKHEFLDAGLRNDGPPPDAKEAPGYYDLQRHRAG